MSLSAVEAATGLLNRGDAHGVTAAGRLDLDLVADSVSDQRLAHGGLVADPTGFGVGLGRAHDAVGLLVGAIFGESHGAAHADFAGRAPGLDQHVVLDDRLELAD